MACAYTASSCSPPSSTEVTGHPHLAGVICFVAEGPGTLIMSHTRSCHPRGQSLVPFRPTRPQSQALSPSVQSCDLPPLAPARADLGPAALCSPSRLSWNVASPQRPSEPWTSEVSCRGSPLSLWLRRVVALYQSFSLKEGVVCQEPKCPSAAS